MRLLIQDLSAGKLMADWVYIGLRKQVNFDLQYPDFKIIELLNLLLINMKIIFGLTTGDLTGHKLFEIEQFDNLDCDASVCNKLLSGFISGIILRVSCSVFNCLITSG